MVSPADSVEVPAARSVLNLPNRRFTLRAVAGDALVETNDCSGYW